MTDPINELIKRSRLASLKKLPLAQIFRKHKPTIAKDYLRLIDEYLRINHSYGLKEIIDKCYDIRNSVTEANGYSYEEVKHAILQRLGKDALNGFLKEEEAKIELKRIFPKIGFLSKADWDENYAVDFGIVQNHKLFCAIQVKSKSFKHSATSTSDILNAKNKHNSFENKFGEPVFFLYYGKAYFENLPEVISMIHQHFENKWYYYDEFNADVK